MGREMDYHVDAAQRLLPILAIAHVTEHPFGVRVQPVGPLAVAHVDGRRQIVQHADAVARPQQFFHRMRADESGSARDQRSSFAHAGIIRLFLKTV